MSLSFISPTKTQRLLREGATLIDIRESDGFVREAIADARNLPLSTSAGRLRAWPSALTSVSQWK